MLSDGSYLFTNRKEKEKMKWIAKLQVIEELMSEVVWKRSTVANNTLPAVTASEVINQQSDYEFDNGRAKRHMSRLFHDH